MFVARRFGTRQSQVVFPEVGRCHFRMSSAVGGAHFAVVARHTAAKPDKTPAAPPQLPKGGCAPHKGIVKGIDEQHAAAQIKIAYRQLVMRAHAFGLSQRCREQMTVKSQNADDRLQERKATFEVFLLTQRRKILRQFADREAFFDYFEIKPEKS